MPGQDLRCSITIPGGVQIDVGYCVHFQSIIPVPSPWGATLGAPPGGQGIVIPVIIVC